MAPRTIDYQASTVTVRTRAKGLLSRLAHDLELVARELSGEVDLDGDRWSAELRFPVEAIRVVGVVRAGSVDRAVLSSADKQDIESRMREALRGPEVRVRASGASRERADVTIIAPGGECRAHVPLTVEARRDGELVAFGRVEASLRALGVPEIKGPLGAFKVDDAIEIAFWIMLEAP